VKADDPGCRDVISLPSRRGLVFIRLLAIAVAVLANWAAAAAEQQQKEGSRVCADPNNLPFSNDRNGGFESRTHAAYDASRERHRWFESVEHDSA
jgi:hypothetical protein